MINRLNIPQIEIGRFHAKNSLEHFQLIVSLIDLSLADDLLAVLAVESKTDKIKCQRE